MSNISSQHLSKKSPYKPTDFRHKLWKEEFKARRFKAKQRSFRVEYEELSDDNMSITAVVDTTKARSAIDVLRLCLAELKWREYHYGSRHSGRCCDVHWNSVTFNDDIPMPTSGKINKFPGMSTVLHKVNLGRVLDVMQRLYPSEYDFHPRQWFLPQQLAELSDAARRARATHRRPVYIAKPDEGSQGDGIYLISDPTELNFAELKPYIVQEYISRPLLLDNLKFDLRVYAVVTRLAPLEIHICREGLARFCTLPYSPPTPANISQTFMHLTNYSLNKASAAYEHTPSEDDGSKRTLSGVLRRLATMGHDVHTIRDRIEMVVVKTLMAIAPDLKIYYRVELPPHVTRLSCFQILGFDILLKEDGRPVLLELNANPSLRIDFEAEVSPGIFQSFYSQVDEKIKKALVLDTLLLVVPTKGKQKKNGAESKEQEEEEEEGRGYGSLEEIYPSKYGRQYAHIGILERMADIFVDSLGVRGHLRMGATAFRMFASRCCFADDQKAMSSFSFTNAAFDILYIGLQRRWEHMNTSSSTGLCFQAFVEAFLQLARKMIPADSLLAETRQLVAQYRPANAGRRAKSLHLSRRAADTGKPRRQALPTSASPNPSPSRVVTDRDE